MVIQFLALTIEALRTEFEFTDEEIDRYTRKVNDLLESVELGYLDFEDVLNEMSLKPMDVVRLSDDVIEEKQDILSLVLTDKTMQDKLQK